ncbi:MAG: hypothetical protein RLZZ301_762 [Bacteroidota bacterium]|jgi:threonine/homoserine/homoserine lactone efflux protein
MDFFFQAFSIGLVLSVMPGPVFFVLLETSITKGIKAAVSFDFGVLISDVVYILLAVLFVEQINSLLSGQNKHYFDLIGGLIFVIYGFVNWFKKSKLSKGDKELEEVSEKFHLSRSPMSKSNHVLLSAKGFLLNFANPLVVFYWLMVASVARRSSEDDSIWMSFFFLGIVLFTFFAIDFLKIVLAKRLRNWVNERMLDILNKVIGVLFTGFGCFFIGRFLLH